MLTENNVLIGVFRQWW